MGRKLVSLIVGHVMLGLSLHEAMSLGPYFIGGSDARSLYGLGQLHRVCHIFSCTI
jgi:hypothetical protein